MPVIILQGVQGACGVLWELGDAVGNVHFTPGHLLSLFLDLEKNKRCWDLMVSGAFLFFGLHHP